MIMRLLYVSYAIILLPCVMASAAWYSITISPDISLTVSPLLGDVSNVSATLTYEFDTVGNYKIQVKGEGIPPWLDYLKVVATDISPGGGTAAPEVTLSPTYIDFITGFGASTGSFSATPRYTVKMTTWATAAGTSATVTVTYKFMEAP